MAGAKKSEFAIRMDAIQKAIDPSLNKLGFKKQGRTYNRSFEPGIIQVVNFQMGSFDPPVAGEPATPKWLKPNLYGKFAVTLGVYVDEIARTTSPPKQRKIVPESSCALRIRLGQLINLEDKEYWWNLASPTEAVAEDVQHGLLTDGIAFLERFSTREKIVSDWVHFNEQEFATTLRARLDVGIMLAAAGNKDRAAGLIKEHLARPTHNKHHGQYVLELAKKLDIDLGQ